MPKHNIDYSKMLFYIIKCKDLNIKECYIGHTSNFRKRESLHKSNCNNKKCKSHNLKIYIFIRNNGGFDNWEMIKIEDYPCNNNLECSQRERYWIENNNATLNKNIPSRTKEEWYCDNKDKILDIKRYYYNNNKKIILDKLRQCYNCNIDNKNKKRQYYINNKEVILDKARQRYKNKKLNTNN